MYPHDPESEMIVDRCIRQLISIDDSTCQLAIDFPPAASIRKEYRDLLNGFHALKKRLKDIAVVRDVW